MPAKPTVTSEHLKKYDEIMKSMPSSNTYGDTKKSILSSIPKPKGLGNKIFVFTGRKKIIMDGSEKEVEKARTVGVSEMKKLQKKEEMPETPSQKKLQAEKEIKENAHKTEEKPERKTGGKNSTKPLIIVGIVIIIGWTIFWAYMLGFFSLFGL